MIESFSQSHQKYNVKGWNKIIECIFVYYIEKGLQHLEKDRIKNYFYNHYSDNNIETIDRTKYISLSQTINGTSSSIQKIFNIEKNEIMVLKAFNDNDDNCQKLYKRELSAYLNINHPFIPKFFGLINTSDTNGLIMEEINGTSLNKIREMNLSIDEKMKIIYEIMILIEYIHNKHYIYRDLKPNNIIIDSNKTCILIDFDRLITADEPIETDKRTKALNFQYCAPELDYEFSYEVDIFSLGLLIHFIYFEELPATEQNSRYEYTLKDFKEYSFLKNICIECLNIDPKKRPKISTIIDIFCNECFLQISNQISEIDTIKSTENIHSIDYYEYWSCIGEYQNYFAQIQLAKIYEAGDLFPKNLHKANDFYAKANKILIMQIENKELQELYLNFTFIYNMDDNEQKILDKLQKFKFMTYYISDIQNSKKYSKIVLCGEKTCIIFEKIDIALFKSILSQLKAKIIDVSEKNASNEEIENFYKFYENEIERNDFIELTIRPISAYIIKRYFFPSNYFCDTTFFSFAEDNNDILSKKSLINIFNTKNYEELKENERKLYPAIFKRQTELLSDTMKVHYYTFKINDFILLKQWESQQKQKLQMVYYRKKNYIFMIKIINKDMEDIDKEYFCKLSTNDSFVPFYGFVEDENTVIGLVYEYLNNGLFINNLNQTNQIQCLTLLVRFFLAIDHIYTYNLKPKYFKISNIFIDHNGIPYFSYPFSFLPNNNQQETNKYNDSLINLLSEIIYLVFEHKVYTKSNTLPNIEKCSKSIQNIFNSCLTFKNNDKLTINNIYYSIINEFEFINFSNYYIIGNNETILPNHVIDLSYEMIRLLTHVKRIDIMSSILVDFFNDPFLIMLKLKGDFAELYYQIGLGNENGFKDRKFYDIAKYYYEESIKFDKNRKHSKSLYHLGHLYEKGYGVEQDFQQAIKLYEMAGDNNLYALINLGLLYENGLGVQQNTTKAKEYFLKAIEKNNSEVAFQIGEKYYNGELGQCDISKAIEYYEIAASKLNPKALFKLGNMYENGNLEHQIVIDYIKAKDYYEKAGELKYSDAYVRIGNFYYYGNNDFECSHSKARIYYEKAAELNNPQANFQLGLMYRENYGDVPKDIHKSNQKFIHYALIQSKTLLNLGLFYENGYGVEKDGAKAKKIYKLSSELNNANIFFHLGLLYKNGNGVEKNVDKAKYYFKKFSKCGNYDISLINRDFQDPTQHFITPSDYFKQFSKKNSKDLLNLAKLYEKGQGVNKNCKIAEKLYELAYEFNKKNAYNLGRFYEKGCDDDKNMIAQNYKLAKNYYEISANENDSKSRYHLGNIFEKGLGCPQNYSMAKKYFELSSQNDFKSCYRLGKIYFNGIGIEINIDKAIYYFNKCIQLFDNLKANYNKRNIYKYLSYNYLGLIYISTASKDYVKIENCIKQSGLHIFMYCMNNLGLFYQYLKNDIKNSYHYYEEASKKDFPLACYNLGFLYEMNGNYEKAVKNYTNASINEDMPLTIQNKIIDDEYYKISKTFIICLTNLKLTNYYLSKSDYEKGEIFFEKVFAKLITDTNKFCFEINRNDKNNIFSYIKNFIFNFSDFKLGLNCISKSKPAKSMNQAIIKIAPLPNLSNEIPMSDDKKNQPHLKKSNQHLIIKKIKKYDKCFDKIYVKNLSISFQKEKSDKVLISGPKQLFKFAIQNENYINMLINIITQTIYDMNKIINENNRLILFGRMPIKKIPTPIVLNMNSQAVSRNVSINAVPRIITPQIQNTSGNNLFYEGLSNHNNT